MSSRLYERTMEISAIDAALDNLDDGRGSCLALEGRAGRGKSTLVEYAVERARERGAKTWVVRARHLASAAPFEVLRRLLGPAVEEAGGVDALDGAARFAIPLFTPGAGDHLAHAGWGALTFGGLYAVAFYGSALVYGAGAFGFGDVKLAPVLGAALGWFGWGPTLVGLMGAFAIGAVVGLVLMVSRILPRMSKVPYGPFMLTGALAGLIFGAGLWKAYLTFYGLA